MVLMAGRAAEEVCFASRAAVSLGATADLESAEHLASTLVLQGRMGGNETDIFTARFRGPDAANHLDRQIARFLAAAYEETKHLLEERKADLLSLAELLLAKRTISGSDVYALLERKPGSRS